MRAVLFDLDGTLADTAPDLAASIDAMLRGMGRPTRGEDAVRAWIGNGVTALVARALTGADDAPVDPVLHARALERFWPLYRQHNGRRSRLYPGVREGLEHLGQQGMRLGCVTNKPRAFTLPLLAHLGLGERFSSIVCGDDPTGRKPDPAPLLAAAERLECAVEETLLVGDSSNDVHAARAAGMAVWCVPYGYNHGRDIRDARPDRVIDDLRDLVPQVVPPRAGPIGGRLDEGPCTP